MNFGYVLRAVKEKNPLVLALSNYVTARDVANCIIACGGSPIFSDDPTDVGELAQKADALLVNLGTVSKRTFEMMKIAVRIAKERKIPVVLDPVGAGATRYRSQCALELLMSGGISVVRGNIAEIKSLLGEDITVHGVDAPAGELCDMDAIRFVKRFAQEARVIAVATGEMDIVSDGERVILCRAGDKLLGKITGSGCQLSALVATFLGAEYSIDSVAAAIYAMGRAGEVAATGTQGVGTFAYKLLDALSTMNPQDLESEKVYEI